MTEIRFLGNPWLRQRLAPFALTLAAGLALSGTFGRGPMRFGCKSKHAVRQSARAAAPAERRARSRTWLVVERPAWKPLDTRPGDAEGTMRFRVVFGEDGAVRDISMLDSAVESNSSREAARDFSDRALDAITGIRFRPATVDGRPVALGATVEYNCFSYHFAHRPVSECHAKIVEVEGDWRVVYE
jgi:hypothetical protein